MNDRYDVSAPQKFSVATWKKLWPFLRPVRYRFLFAMSLIFFSAVVDVIIPLFTRYAVDSFIVLETTDGLAAFGLTYAAVLTFQGILIILYFRQCMVVEMELGRQM